MFISAVSLTVPCLEGDSLREFLKRIDEVDPTSAILKIVEPFALARKVADYEKLPRSLLSFYNESFETYSLEDIQTDGLIMCDYCGSICIEIKGPFVLKDTDITIEQFAKMKGSCLVKENDKFFLLTWHSYYYQVILPMSALKLS